MPRPKEYSEEEAKKCKNMRDREQRKKKNETMTDAQKAAQTEGWARQTRDHMKHINFVSKKDGQITAGLPIKWTLERCWDNVITRSDFKSETIFGFLSPNYTGQHT